MLKQNVWIPPEVTYIDELVQTSINPDSVSDPQASSLTPQASFYILQNANFNVMMLVDTSGGGDSVERYEYTPYGKRTVYYSPGTNDPLAMATTTMSRRVQVAGVDQPYGMLEFGHQGLLHDEESGLVENRARMLSPRMGRFMQRDPWMRDETRPTAGDGYQNGMSLYQYVESDPVWNNDPNGKFIGFSCNAWSAKGARYVSGFYIYGPLPADKKDGASCTGHWWASQDYTRTCAYCFLRKHRDLDTK